jgi:hypothetical protein
LFASLIGLGLGLAFAEPAGAHASQRLRAVEPTVDITEVILSDHHERRRMSAMLDGIDRSDTATLRVLWTRLASMLEVHAQAEELFFYPELLKLGRRLDDDSEVDETQDAISDHNDIRDGITEASQHDVGSDGWWSGVNAARHANDEHMGEEEHEGLADFRRHVDLDTRHRIAVVFAAYEAEHVDGGADPGQGSEAIRPRQRLIRRCQLDGDALICSCPSRRPFPIPRQGRTCVVR